MAAFVLRLWVPDRPGALGAVASRIGAVRGDLLGIDILERGGGRAIDELILDLPDAELVPLLVSEVSQVDGVDVEDVRPMTDPGTDPRLDALETAASLVCSGHVEALLEILAEQALRDFQAEWSAVVDTGSPLPVVTVGSPPPAPWLAAFVAGSRASVAPVVGDNAPDDVAWADLASAGLVVVLGRRGRPFRTRERRQLGALSNIADHRWVELVSRRAPKRGPVGARDRGLTAEVGSKS